MRGNQRRYLLRGGCRLGVGRADPTRAGEGDVELDSLRRQPAGQSQRGRRGPFHLRDRELGCRAPQLRRPDINDLAVAPHDVEVRRVLDWSREHDVLRLMARGSTNPEIAAMLFVSEATVKSHVGAIFAKLDVRDRAAAIVFAYDHGIVDPHG